MNTPTRSYTIGLPSSVARAARLVTLHDAMRSYAGPSSASASVAGEGTLSENPHPANLSPLERHCTRASASVSPPWPVSRSATAMSDLFVLTECTSSRIQFLDWKSVGRAWNAQLGVQSGNGSHSSVVQWRNHSQPELTMTRTACITSTASSSFEMSTRSSTSSQTCYPGAIARNRARSTSAWSCAEPHAWLMNM